MFNLWYKRQFVVEQCIGRTVLDLGCVDAELWRSRLREELWQHARIRKVARRVVGVDVLRDEIPSLNAEGFDIRYGDLERLEALEIDFVPEIIVAGDVIEHLSNPGLFLDGLRRFFGPSTRLVLTTPNAWWWQRSFDAFIRRERVREDHTCWYSANTLRQVMERHGYRIVDTNLTLPLRFHVTGPFSALDALMLLISRRLSERLVVIAEVAAP